MLKTLNFLERINFCYEAPERFGVDTEIYNKFDFCKVLLQILPQFLMFEFDLKSLLDPHCPLKLVRIYVGDSIIVHVEFTSNRANNRDLR